MKLIKNGKETIRLTEFIEELKHFHTIYSAADVAEEMAEELLIYKQVINWLEELKRRREGEYPYIVDFADISKDEGNYFING